MNESQDTSRPLTNGAVNAKYQKYHYDHSVAHRSRWIRFVLVM